MEGTRWIKACAASCFYGYFTWVSSHILTATSTSVKHTRRRQVIAGILWRGKLDNHVEKRNALHVRIWLAVAKGWFTLPPSHLPSFARISSW